MFFKEFLSRRFLTALVSIYPVSILFTAANAQQINNQSDGHITVVGPTYTDNGGESLIVNGSTNSITIKPVSGRVSAGSVRIEGGGGFTAYDTDFTGGSRTGPAVLARDFYNAGATIKLFNSTIRTVETNFANTTSRHASRALEARNSNIVDMTGGSIISRLHESPDPTGVLAWSGGGRTYPNTQLATMNINNVDIHVSDVANTVSGTGVRSVQGGQIFVTGSTITVGHDSNISSKGLESDGVAPGNRGAFAGTPSKIVIKDSTIKTYGSTSVGAWIHNSGFLHSQNSNFVANGAESIGIMVDDNSEASIEGGKIEAQLLDSVGVRLNGNAQLELTNTDVKADGAVALITNTSNSVTSSELSVSGGELIGGTDVVHVDAASSDVNFSNVQAFANDALLRVVNSGEVDFRLSQSAAIGNILVDNSSSADVALTDKSSLTGYIQNAAVSIDSSSIWNVMNSSTLSNLNNHGSIVFSEPSDPSNPSAFKIVKTDNYHSDGGNLVLNTVLGDDASATDKLVIEGNSSGTSNVRIINAKGPGALTTEGIEIITVGGNSDAVFSLQGLNGSDYIVAGAYTYRLHKNNTSGTDPKDWYLRSAVTPVNPPEPKPEPKPEPQREYHVGSPVYESYAQSLLGLNGVGSLHERVGNRFWAGGGNRVIAEGADAIVPYAAPEEAGVHVDGNGVWGRIEGSHNSIDPRFSTTGTEYRQNTFKLQAGVDGLLTENENGTLIGGIFVQYVHGKTKTNSGNYADGEISTDGYGFGGTLTWYGNEGFYIDSQAQVTWYDSDLTTSAFGAPTLTDGNNGIGYALSLETGKRFAIDPEWSITPQAQLVYSSVDFDDFTDGFGSHVSLDRGDSLQGRLGITLDHENSWQNAKGLMNRSHVYGIANLYYEFLEGTKVNIEDVSFASKKDRLWGGIGIGGSYNWDNDKYSIYGEGIVNTSLNNFGGNYSLKGNVGFRVKW